MIILNNQLFIEQGLHRACYIHPADKKLCLKVNTHENKKDILREKKYYRHLEKRKVPWDMIPRYYGEVETNLGKGAVFDLITDADGNISKRLHHYLSSAELTQHFLESISKSLKSLKEYLFTYRIITMDLDPTNILCQKNGATIAKLYIVDNVYNTEFIPMSNYSKIFAKKKITRKWNRFEKKLLESYPDNKFVSRLIAESKK